MARGNTDEFIMARKRLIRDGRVLALSRELGVPVTQVLGCLWIFWSIADEFVDEKDRLPGYERADIDAEVGLPGFAEALPACWLTVRRGKLYLPQWQRHNGTSAKIRAGERLRKRQQRKPENVSGQTSGQVSGHCPDLEREKEIEIEKNTKRAPRKSADVAIPSELDSDEFKTAWSEWLAYRRERKLTCTARTLTKQLAFLVGLGRQDAIASINASVQNGWQGLFEQGRKDGTRAASRSGRPSGRFRAEAT